MLHAIIHLVFFQNWLRKVASYIAKVEMDQWFFLLAVGSLVIVFYLIKPVVSLCIELKWNNLIAYVVTILLFSNVIVLLKYNTFFDTIFFSSFYLIPAIATFGIIVIILRISQLVISYKH